MNKLGTKSYRGTTGVTGRRGAPCPLASIVYGSACGVGHSFVDEALEARAGVRGILGPGCFACCLAETAIGDDRWA